MRGSWCLVVAAVLLAGCRGGPGRSPKAEPARPAAPATRPGLAGEILSLPAGDVLAAERLRTRLHLVLGDPGMLECVAFLRSDAGVDEKARVVDFLAGTAHPSLMDWLVETVGAEATPQPLVLACHRALCAATFLRVLLDPDLHYEARRALVARDWAAWWHRNRETSPSEWLARRLPTAHEFDRLEIVRHLIRVGDAAAVAPLMVVVDSGTLEFRAAALYAVSYLTNTVFAESPLPGAAPDPRPPEVQMLDGVLRALEWWKTAQARAPEQWIREGFAARGVVLHDPPAPVDLVGLARLLEDRHPAVRSQALRHLIRWTGQVFLEDTAGGSEAFRRMAEQWRGWIDAHRDRLEWDGEGRFREAAPGEGAR